MEKFTVSKSMPMVKAGQVVLVTFPFSNFKKEKLRPALVLATAEFNNLILCQITSKPYSSKTALKIDVANFLSGRLPVTSYVRVDKLLTADNSLIKEVLGELNTKTKNLILQRVRQLF
jgi:mRNA interferase MazF